MPNTYYTSSVLKKPQSSSPDLPAITLTTSDEHDSTVTMTLAPEAGVSSSDVMKLMMLMVATMGGGGDSFNALAYVKKHNLERHFTYA